MKPQEPDQLDYLSQHIETLEKENELFARQLTVRNEGIRILKQTIKNLETGRQKELAAVTKELDEARARIEKLKTHLSAFGDAWIDYQNDCEEKEPTT